MLIDKHAGIDCLECGHEESVTTKAELQQLIDKLEWSSAGDPYCPECGNTVTLENYIDDELATK
jgi:transcription elongation factor Elf1